MKQMKQRHPKRKLNLQVQYADSSNKVRLNSIIDIITLQRLLATITGLIKKNHLFAFAGIEYPLVIKSRFLES